MVVFLGPVAVRDGGPKMAMDRKLVFVTVLQGTRLYPLIHLEVKPKGEP